MRRKSPIPASRSPSTICCKTGLPRTSIIGFGSSAVSSRIRVPRPAASITALSIVLIVEDGGARSAIARLFAALRVRRRGSSALHSSFRFLRLRDNQRGQIRLFDQFADLRQVVLLELRPFIQLLVKLA